MGHVSSAKPVIPRFYVVGDPIEHSKSPEIHLAFARQIGMQLVYEKVRVRAGSLKKVVSEFEQAGGIGLNVTTPLKQEAWSLASLSSEQSESAKAANTLWFEQGAIACDNTDGVGLVRDLEQNVDFSLDGRKVLLLGAGGAARGVVPSLFESGVSKLLVSNRTDARAALLADDYEGSGKVSVLKWGYESDLRPDLIINATSASLGNELPNIGNSCIHPNVLCYDLMYSPSETPFVTWAKSKNVAFATDGLGMLVEQAAASFKIWHREQVETGPVISMLRKP